MTTKPEPRFYVHTVLQSGLGRKVENPYWVLDRTTGKALDEYTSKRAATMHAKAENDKLRQQCTARRTSYRGNIDIGEDMTCRNWAIDGTTFCRHHTPKETK